MSNTKIKFFKLPLIITSKRKKIFGNNLQSVRLLQCKLGNIIEIKDISEWKDILHSWFRKFDIV